MRGSCGSSIDGVVHGQEVGRGHWRPSEDEMLRRLVGEYGPRNWKFLSENLPGRSGKSCRLRWFNQLDPTINRSPLTEEEEERLLAAHRIYGNKWSSISRFFPGRTDNSLKNQWHLLNARRQRAQTRATSVEPEVGFLKSLASSSLPSGDFSFSSNPEGNRRQRNSTPCYYVLESRVPIGIVKSEVFMGRISEEDRGNELGKKISEVPFIDFLGVGFRS